MTDAWARAIHRENTRRNPVSFKDAWTKAGQPADDFDPPDGAYSVTIVDGGAFTGNDGRQWAKVILKIRDGEHEGRQFTDFMNLNNEVGFRRARDNLTVYGLNPDSVEDFEDLDTGILELTGTHADVTVTHWAEGRINVNVQRTLTGRSDIPDIPGQETFDTTDMQPAAAGRNAIQDDDDIPF